MPNLYIFQYETAKVILKKNMNPAKIFFFQKRMDKNKVRYWVKYLKLIRGEEDRTRKMYSKIDVTFENGY